MKVGAVCIMPCIIPPVHQSWGKSCTDQLIDLSVLGKRDTRKTTGYRNIPGYKLMFQEVAARDLTKAGSLFLYSTSQFPLWQF